MNTHRLAPVLLALLVVPSFVSAAPSPPKTYSLRWQPGFRYHQTPWGAVRISALACPNAHLCAAADTAGNLITTTNPREGRTAWMEHDVQPAGIYDLACPSPHLCIAPLGYAGIKVSSNLFSSGLPAWRSVPIATPTNSVAKTVCAGVGLCIVLSSLEESSGGFWVTTTPAGGKSAWKFVKPATPAIYDIACPSIHLCIGVGYSGRVVYSRTPDGSASSWKSFQIGSKTESLMAVTCPSVNFCAATDSAGSVYTSRSPVSGPGGWGRADIDGTAYLTGVACPSSGECLVTDNLGKVFSSGNPGGGVGAWHAITLVTGESFEAHCVSASLCFAFGSAGDMANTTKPASRKRSAWSVNQVDGEAYLKDVSCGSKAMCVAVGDNGLVVSSSNPAGGAAAWHGIQLHASPSVIDDFNSVSCPSANFCVAIGGVGDIYTSTNPTGSATAWHMTHVDAMYGGYKMSCPSSFCAAEGGKPVISSPTAATGPWKFEDIELASGEMYLNDIACRSATFCVLAGSITGVTPGAIATSSNPTGDTTQWTVAEFGQPFGGIFCARSSTLCVVVGNQTIASSTNPAGGPSAWSVFKVPFTQVIDVSCGYVCVAVGGSDVFVTDSQQSVKSKVDWKHSALPAAFLEEVSCATSTCIGIDPSGQIFAAVAR